MPKRNAVRRRRRPHRIRQYSKPGTAPGTIQVSRDALRPQIDLMCYATNRLEEQPVEQVEDLREFRDRDEVLWVNVCGLGDAQLIRELGQMFGIHPLALEDIADVHQRSKVEDYDDRLFVVLRMIDDVKNEALETEQISIVLGPGFVLTFQERVGDCLDPVRSRIRKSGGRIRAAGADYLAYAIIDCIVDAYFPIVDACGERMERLEAEVHGGRTSAVMADVHAIRGDLVTLRRSMRPLRDALSRLAGNAPELISRETLYYFRDCSDHVVQLLELIDNHRELCADLRDYYLSIMNQHMNEVIRVLTIISTVFIPLSFITSLYGMNFNTDRPGNMPELNWPYGYAYAIGLMATAAFGLVVFIWRQGWLGPQDPSLENEWSRTGPHKKPSPS